MKRLAVFFLAFVLCLAAFAVGRQTKEPSSPAQDAATLRVTLKLMELAAKSSHLGGKPNDDTSKSLAQAPALLKRVAANPEAGIEFADGILSEYYDDHAVVESAPQATEAATEASVRLQYMQVAQNAQIIALLQRIADSKK